MGYYISPVDETKEQFLKRNGTKTDPRLFNNFSGPDVLVCLVYNGIFTAAGVAYSESEKQRFLTEDGRAKEWFLVDKSSLPEKLQRDLA